MADQPTHVHDPSSRRMIPSKNGPLPKQKPSKPPKKRFPKGQKKRS